LQGYSKFICDDCDAVIYIKNISIKAVMEKLRNNGNKETGGILVGSYSSSLKDVYINEFSDEPEDSRAGFSWFVRGVRGLKEYLKKKWDATEEYYLGEWHFHPANVPEPSSTDINQLRCISKDRRFNCQEPILCIFSKETNDINITIKLLIKSKVYDFYKELNL
jgi:hypothetical protein